MSISGQIVSEIVAQKTSYKPFSLFFGSTEKKLRRVCMEFCNHVYVDEDLSPNVHIDKIGKRLSLALVLDCLSLNLAPWSWCIFL